MPEETFLQSAATEGATTQVRGRLDVDPITDTPLLSDLTYTHIRRAIIAQRLRPGEWLRQEEIATELGVSRLPVREALRKLDAEGLVVLKPRRGYFVMSLDPAEITEVFTIRAMLEGRTGRLAALNRTQEDIDYMVDVQQRIDAMVLSGNGDFAELGRYNFMFHDRLHALSGMKHARRILHSLNDIGERYVRMGASLATTVQQMQIEHWAILNAFEAGDATKTESLCYSHCEDFGNRLLQYIQRASSHNG